MFDNISYWPIFHVREADILLALLFSSLIQICLITISILIKKSFSPKPFVEIILNPIGHFLSIKLNKDNRTAFTLIIRGIVVITLMGLCGAALMFLIQTVFQKMGWTEWINVVLLMLVLSPLYPLYLALTTTYKKRQDKTFYHLSNALNQNMVRDDDHAIRRNTFRLLSLSIIEWFIAPVILYIIGGIVFVYMYTVISIFVRLNLCTKQSSQFLSLFLIAYKILQIIINIILTPITIISAAITTRGRPLQVFKAFSKLQNTLGQYAYALNITLGGPIQDRLGNTHKLPWVGAAKTSAKIVNGDIHRGLILQSIILLISVAILLALYIYA
jgi:cobalamin biosynthesis protein CobD/CbiB